MSVHMMMDEAPLVVWLGFWAIGVAIFTFVYGRYLRIRFFRAFLLAMAGEFAWGALLMTTHGRVLDASPLFIHNTLMRSDDEGPCLAFMLAIMLGIGLAVKIYLAWIMDTATSAEREPNGKGIRAWLSPANLTVAVGLVITAYIGMGWSPWGMAAGVLGLLLAYPLANFVLKGNQTPADGESEALAEERRRVLALVEAGKISGEDGAELIGALGQSHEVGAMDRGVMTGNRRLMMLGAALVIVGFCLPWFEINIGAQMQDAMNSMQQAMPAEIPLPPGYPVQVRRILIVRGGDIQYGLGWIILAMGVGVALLPLVWVTRRENREAQRGASLVGLLVGTVLVMYLVANSFEHMDIGMFLVLAAYVVLWVGAVREYLRPVGQAVLAVR